jgi:outer membrane biosynthesis protein TonB
MDEKPVLMHNTQTGAYLPYNKKSVEHMTNLLPVYRGQVTPEIEAKACLPIGLYSDPDGPVEEPKKEEPVKAQVKEKVEEPAPEPAPEPVPEPEPVVQEVVNRPNTDGWGYQQLLDFTQANEIPIHPNAKENGIRTAIDRFFDQKEQG